MILYVFQSSFICHKIISQTQITARVVQVTGTMFNCDFDLQMQIISKSLQAMPSYQPTQITASYTGSL